MKSRNISVWSLSLLALALGLAGWAEDAGATTICVPAFSSACPEGGGNVAKTDVEEAMSFQASDGKADEIRIAAGTFTETGAFEPEAGTGTGTYEPHGSDPLAIVGAGPGATKLTSAASGNIFLFNLGSNNSRAIVIRDLTALIPASFDNGVGSAFQMTGDTLDNVDIVSLNEGSDGVASAVGPGNVFRNGEIRGEAGGSIDDSLRSSSAGGSLLVEDARVVGASWALQTTGATSDLIARRVSVVGARTYGVIVTRGTLEIENSTMTIDDGVGLYVSAGAESASLSANHVTIVNSGASSPAIQIEKTTGVGKATVTVSNSILRGFPSGYALNAAAGPGIGVGTLGVRYSNFSAEGTSSGVLDVATGNIDVDPQLAADFSLPLGSPSVDAGDPAAGLVTDFVKALRPTDGDGDGVARRDQGAFEYQPPAKLSPEDPDVTAPQTKIKKGPGGKLAKGEAKFSFKSSEAGSRFACKLDGHKAGGCKSPRAYKHLKPGRHVFKVWAIDRAGNKDPSAAKRRFLVPR